MDQTLYFTLFIGFIAICMIGSLAYRRPMRPCPACDEQIPIQSQRCRHCEYSFLPI